MTSNKHLTEEFEPISRSEHPELFPGAQGEDQIRSWEERHGPMEPAADATQRLNAKYGVIND